MTATRSVGPVAVIPIILVVTFRQLLGRRRTILLALLCALPVLLGLIYWAAGEADVKQFSEVIYDGMIVTTLLPIVAVLVGSAAFGAEIEEGTIVYLLAKPVGRWRIVLAKLLGAAGFCALLIVASIVLSGAVAILAQPDGAAAIAAYAVAAIVGSICYCSLFVALSLYTRRALVIGIGYVLIWEGGLANLLPGIANLSVRQYALGAGKAAWDGVTAPLGPQTAFLLAAILVVAAAVIATFRLARFELPSNAD